MSRRKFGWSAFVLLALAIEPAGSSADNPWEAIKEGQLTATGRCCCPMAHWQQTRLFPPMRATCNAARTFERTRGVGLSCGVSSAITAESTRIRPIGSNRRGL